MTRGPGWMQPPPFASLRGQAAQLPKLSISFLTVGVWVGASSYPAQSAGDALALSDSPLESRGRPGEGEKAAATSWRTRPKRGADARPLGTVESLSNIQVKSSLGGCNE